MSQRRAIELLWDEADERAATNEELWEQVEALLKPPKLPGQIPIPTLAERASLYMRAMYGDRDFTNEEYSRARDLMLETMAGNIGGNSKTNFPPQIPEDLDARHIVCDATLPPTELSLDSFESADLPRPRANQAHCQSADLSPTCRSRVRRSDESEDNVIASWILPATTPPPPVISRTRPARRGIHIRAIVGAAGVASLLLITAFSAVWFFIDRSPVGLNVVENNFQVPAGRMKELSARADRVGIAAPAEKVGGGGPIPAGQLLQHGRELIAAGSISAARSVLRQLADAGDADAALELGGTYDPIILKERELRTRPRLQIEARSSASNVQSSETLTGVRIVSEASTPDIAMARAWYEKARDFGSAEAARRLSKLSEPAAVPGTQVAPPK
jgi:hypothetical protein